MNGTLHGYKLVVVQPYATYTKRPWVKRLFSKDPRRVYDVTLTERIPVGEFKLDKTRRIILGSAASIKALQAAM